MKLRVIALLVLSFLMPHGAVAESTFRIEEYRTFLEDNRDLSAAEIMARHAAKTTYYTGIQDGVTLDEYAYLDSISQKYGLTASERELLEQNRFVVTERLSFNSFGWALYDIYNKDLPVFVTTDVILHALHASYDRILMDIEEAILEPQLVELLRSMYDTFPQLIDRYGGNEEMQEGLGDVDLYITMALSLISDTQYSPLYGGAETFDALWNAVQSEQMVSMPLFSERNRALDFSQFTVRGHYAEPHPITGKDLGPYFKCMMWLGRMDFMLTPPPTNPWEVPWSREEIRRMNLGAVLVHELIELADVRSLLDSNDETITFMVGESDNLTPAEFATIIDDRGITGADNLLDDEVYDAYQAALTASGAFGQKILSALLLMDPFSPETDVLPVSFRLMGQRFVVDSYVFSNVVYDRIIYEDRKIWRPLPDPLDAMYVLGNDDALPLLAEELETYHYASQLEALRYLVDAYDDSFWNMSLYNVWLQALRELNPPADKTGMPLFMHTTAWQQEKLNTQLASWAQLRHDTLLYAKQSYTGGIGCSLPHSFVEPYPAFYHRIGDFAERAGAYFADFPSTTWPVQSIQMYFPRLKAVMDRLEAIAQKELDGEPFTEDEKEYLCEMLFTTSEEYAVLPFDGWFVDLFYDSNNTIEGDYLVADVHTQPTDEFGNVVGRVLHVGVGMINLGMFLADSPSDGYQPMAYVGPVMSYYEAITDNFDRLTDERWTTIVENHDVPPRPDWVNIYLANGAGNTLSAGRELPGIVYTDVGEQAATLPRKIALLRNYPNPFNPVTTITFTMPATGHATLTIYNIAGQTVRELLGDTLPEGRHAVVWDGCDDAGNKVSAGLYLSQLVSCGQAAVGRMMLVK